MKGAKPKPALSREEIDRINEGFRKDVDRYDFRYRCVDCSHVNPQTKACSLDYPNEMLQEGEVRAMDESGEFVFCKDFEFSDGPEGIRVDRELT